jgi:hypothetical protein
MTVERTATGLPPGVTKAEQPADGGPAPAEAWPTPLPPRPAFAPDPAPPGAMTPERHAAILHAAARTGSWESAERATREVAGQWMLAAFRRLLHRLLRR